MSDEIKKTGLHIHFFRLIIIIAIIFVLVKVDIKSVIKSPQFQENISYAKEQVVNLWEKYLAEPLNNAWNNLFKNLVNKGIDQAKDVVDTKLDNLKQ